MTLLYNQPSFSQLCSYGLNKTWTWNALDHDITLSVLPRAPQNSTENIPLIQGWEKTAQKHFKMLVLQNYAVSVHLKIFH